MTSAAALPAREVASLRVRLAAMIYEGVLLTAILLLATALFVAVFGDSRMYPQRAALQLYLVSIAGGYFTWNWSAGRRTLPMRTWRLYLADRTGAPPGVPTALVRYLAAVIGILACGIGLAWVLVDPERQFLHDRVAGTRLLRHPPASG